MCDKMAELWRQLGVSKAKSSKLLLWRELNCVSEARAVCAVGFGRLGQLGQVNSRS